MKRTATLWLVIMMVISIPSLSSGSTLFTTSGVTSAYNEHLVEFYTILGFEESVAEAIAAGMEPQYRGICTTSAGSLYAYANLDGYAMFIAGNCIYAYASYDRSMFRNQHHTCLAWGMTLEGNSATSENSTGLLLDWYNMVEWLLKSPQSGSLMGTYIDAHYFSTANTSSRLLIVPSGTNVALLSGLIAELDTYAKEIFK